MDSARFVAIAACSQYFVGGNELGFRLLARNSSRPRGLRLLLVGHMRVSLCVRVLCLPVLAGIWESRVTAVIKIAYRVVETFMCAQILMFW